MNGQRLCVIGSLNVDLTVRLSRFHRAGETVFGSGFAMYAGGKGGNAATAMARLGADVLMVGRLGLDQHGAFYRASLIKNGVDVSGVEDMADAPTGVALIEVDDAGENRIAVVSGANMAVDAEQIDRLWPLIVAQDVFMLQLELPLETVAYTISRLRAAGKTVLLDPAPIPAEPLPQAMLRQVDYLLPNEEELAMLSGMQAHTEAETIAAASRLYRLGARAVLAKRGRHGAVLVTPEGARAYPGFAVDAVDTTAAGDGFGAGFAVGLARGLPVGEAIRLANAVGALSTTAHGAQGAMPSMDAVDALLNA